MDPNITALLEAMKAERTAMQEQQKQFMQTLSRIAEPTPVVQNAAAPPKFEHFDKSKERWEQYFQRLQQHLVLHGITNDDKKRAFLLSCLDPELYELLQNLSGSIAVTNQSFDNLVAKLSAHFKASVHLQAARYSFYKCKMQPHQTYSDWVATLRGLARDCRFECKSDACNHQSFVDEQIRDVILLNTPHPEVRRQCLLEQNISLEDALKKATLYTKTVETDRLLTSNDQPSINNLYTKQSKGRHMQSKSARIARKQWKRCPKCFVDHQPNTCPYVDYTCHKCKKKGHLMAECRSQLLNASAVKSSHVKTVKNEKVGNVFTCSGESVIPEASADNSNIYKRRGNPVWLDVQIQGKELMFQWDTGSTCSMVGKEGYRQLGSPKCEPVSTVLNAYGGRILKVIGKCVLDQKVKKH